MIKLNARLLEIILDISFPLMLADAVPLASEQKVSFTYYTNKLNKAWCGFKWKTQYSQNLVIFLVS